MSSRRHREHASSSRKEDSHRQRQQSLENDPDRARQSLSTTQRHPADPTNTANDRLHRSSRRHDLPDPLASLHSKSSAKDQTSQPSSMHPHHILAQSQNQPSATLVPLSHIPQTQPQVIPTSRSQPQESQRDPYSIRTKRKYEKRSSPSSDEKVLVTDQPSVKTSRFGQQQSRNAYPIADQIASAPPTQQTFWIPPSSSTHEATSAKRKEKERERAKEKERKEREREKSRLRDDQRAKDQARELRRESELRREEEEQRRRRERGRSERREKDKSRDPESRRRDESQSVDPSAPRSTQYPSLSKATRLKYHPSDERTVDQVPYAIPSSVPSQPTVSSRLPSSSAPRREDYPQSSRATQGNVTDHEKRRHRSHRERTAGHQSAQESGMSSSEQEHSGRERSTRTSERRHLTRDNHLDNNHSGPSGSENERASTRSRRKYRSLDPYSSDPSTQGRIAAIATVELNKSLDPRQHAPTHAVPIHPSVPVGSPLVGSAPFTHYVPQIVSIRAGQGPSDPQTPLPHAKSSLAAGAASVRPHEHGGSAETTRPSAPQTVPAYDLVTHPRLQNPPSHLHSQPSVGVPSQPSQHSYPAQPVRPSSTAPHAPTTSHPAAYVSPPTGFSRSHGVPSPAIIPPVLPPKGPINFKQVEMHLPAGSSVPTAHIAKLSVYRAPDHPVAAHLVVPTVHGIPPSITISGSQYSSDVQRSKHASQDLASKFPLNEEMFASIQINAHNAAKAIAPGSNYHYSRPPTVSEGPGNVSQQHGVALPSRSSTYPPLASSTSITAPHVPASSSPLRHNLPNPQPGDDTPRANPLPIPLPEAKVPNTSASQQQPVQIAQAGQLYDPRSPKQSLATPAPILSSSYQPSRPLVSSPLQTKQSAPLPTPIPPSIADSLNGPILPPRSVHTNGPPGILQPSAHNYSPPRSGQFNQLRSPTVPNVNPLAPATPKQSPSGRLHARNGSNDTITQPTLSKYSPPYNPQKTLTQRSSNGNLQASYAASRQDTTPNTTNYSTTNPNHPSNLPPFPQNIIVRPSTSSGYPEPSRYRSPPPSQSSQYPPFGSAGPQQVPHVLPSASSNAVPYIPSIPSGTGHIQHSRSISHPVPSLASVQGQSYDVTASTQSRQVTSTPVPALAQANSAGYVPSVQTTASAYAAAYKSQMEQQASQQSSGSGSGMAQQKVPSRAAPSPVPTINGRSYPGSTPSVSGNPVTSAPAAGTRPTRGHSVSVPVRPATSQGNGSSNVHSRSVSDPQHALQQNPQSRVAVSGHPSTPAMSKGEELLKTPSSLAPSMLPPTSRSSKEKKDKEKKEREGRKLTGGFFGFFRSRSSPPKQATAEARPPASSNSTPSKSSNSNDAPATTTSTSRGRPRASSHSTIVAVAASVKNIVTPHPHHVYQPPSRSSRSNSSRHAQVPVNVPVPATAPTPVAVPLPIIAPTPVQADATMGPGGKMYSPFRLLAKRHRTVSAASYEAQDGTAANTVVGGESTRSSTAGRLSPPARDPGIATIDWRNQEEATYRGKGGSRRYRPGVTFDVCEDDALNQMSSKPVRRSSRRGSTGGN